ncbi:MAG: hypothetical protein ACR2M5_00530 [Nakamurella sp.]
MLTERFFTTGTPVTAATAVTVADQVQFRGLQQPDVLACVVNKSSAEVSARTPREVWV